MAKYSNFSKEAVNRWISKLSFAFKVKLYNEYLIDVMREQYDSIFDIDNNDDLRIITQNGIQDILAFSTAYTTYKANYGKSPKYFKYKVDGKSNVIGYTFLREEDINHYLMTFGDEIFECVLSNPHAYDEIIYELTAIDLLKSLEILKD